MVSRRNKHSSNRGSKTRRATGGTTVEGLHSSFDKIDGKVKSMIAKGKTDSDLARCIQKAWSEQFHMELSMPAVKGLLLHYRAVHGSRSQRKTRKQRGGMAPYAEGSWTMGQGTTDNVYGRFPVEIGTTPQVLKALDLGRFYESTGGRSCNATGGHAAPGQMGGLRRSRNRKQHGAGLFDAFTMGHAPASVPRNVVESTVSTVQGHPIMNPQASPIAGSVQLATFNPKPYDTSAISSISSLQSLYKPY
jgi:hypothetical protein